MAPGGFGRAGYFSDSSETCVAAGAVSAGVLQRMLMEKARHGVCMLGSTYVWACKPMCTHISWVSASLVMFVSECLPVSLQHDL